MHLRGPYAPLHSLTSFIDWSDTATVEGENYKTHNSEHNSRRRELQDSSVEGENHKTHNSEHNSKYGMFS
jgi:hypothetical protein